MKEGDGRRAGAEWPRRLGIRRLPGPWRQSPRRGILTHPDSSWLRTLPAAGVPFSRAGGGSSIPRRLPQSDRSDISWGPGRGPGGRPGPGEELDKVSRRVWVGRHPVFHLGQPCPAASSPCLFKHPAWSTLGNSRLPINGTRDWGTHPEYTAEQGPGPYPPKALAPWSTPR